MIYGYGRVSTVGQDLASQIALLKERGVSEDNIFSEKRTGANTERPKLQELLKLLKSGDTLYVTKLDRLARNTEEGIRIVRELIEQDITVHILNVGVLDDTPIGRFFLTTLLAVAELERSMISERMAEGKAIARLQPDYREGRPKKFTKKQIDHALDMLDHYTYKEVEERTGISKSTLVRARRQRTYSSKEELK